MIKILLLSADPKENHPLNVDCEFKRILEVHKRSTHRDQFSIEQLPSATHKDLCEIVTKFKDTPLIIHFCGHGMGEKGLVFVNENGEKETIDADTLERLFEISAKHDQNIICVIFNACYSDLQAKAISKHVKYVIGMSHEIKDKYAICFSEKFYLSLFEKNNIEKAVDLGRYAIFCSVNQSNTSDRANFDPQPGDPHSSNTIVSQTRSLLDYEIPKLIFNENLNNINDSELDFLKPKRIIKYTQWVELESIISTVDFNILTNVCRDILKKDIQDSESKISLLKDLSDIKELLVIKYPISKQENTINILDFAKRLRLKEYLDDEQKDKIKNWLEKIEKDVTLSTLVGQTERKVLSDINLKSHLLISIIENTGIANKFSLEAELINYQGEELYNKPIPITPEPKGVNAISPEQIENYLQDFIDIAANHPNSNHNLTIELFVPFDFLGESFDIYKIKPIGSRRERKFRIGSKYQFIIHCLDRYENKNLFDKLKERWDGIRQYLINGTNENYLEQKCRYEKIDRDWDDLFNEWEKNDYFSINLINGLPRNDEKEAYFDRFQLSGFPISLWSRSPEVRYYDDRKLDCNVQEEFKKILKIECYKSLSKVFERIHQLRQNPPNDENEAKNYLGYHLGVICDRSDLIPSNLRKRLNQEGLQGSN